MISTIKTGFLSAALAMLALPVVAQTATPPDPQPKSEIGKRMENQQDRIDNGVKDGQLSAGQADRLERNEHKIYNEVQNDRAANVGKLTARQDVQVNRQLNRQSREIYRAKH